MIQSKENWKNCLSAPDYQVSSRGNVRRLTPSCNGTGTYPGRECKKHQDKDGYWTVYLVVAKRLRKFFVHRLVAESFIGECPVGYQVNHKNLNKADPVVENLEYVTPRGNALHAIKNGVPWGNPKGTTKGFCGRRGTDNFLSKLTPEAVKQVRELYITGIGLTDLGKKFDVTPQAIYSIVNYRTWKHVA